ncbi:MAG: T9SS type A sorting domain-containing protein, partial [Flavobacteriales bacterium]|nr:T9SS type A sorting domain-containing protein [Flavobacteriales bacterium]
NTIAEEPAVALALFPVPATDQLTVSGADVNNRTARIFSSTGQLVRSTVVRASTIAIADLEPGVYLLELTTPDRVLKRSFIKE